MKSGYEKDKSNQSICEEGPKNKKKRNFVVLIIVFVIALAAIVSILPPLNLPTSSFAMRIRCDLLTDWYKYVNSYIIENNRIPLSIIEVCQSANEKGRNPFPIQGFLIEDGFPKEYTIDELNDPNGFPPEYTKDLLYDPNRFEKEVPYCLFRGSKGWYIKETKIGNIYKKMLMIDQNGKIYEIRELPRKEYITDPCVAP
jgi:hypothetical protein